MVKSQGRGSFLKCNESTVWHPPTPIFWWHWLCTLVSTQQVSKHWAAEHLMHCTEHLLSLPHTQQAIPSLLIVAWQSWRHRLLQLSVHNCLWSTSIGGKNAQIPWGVLCRHNVISVQVSGNDHVLLSSQELSSKNVCFPYVSYTESGRNTFFVHFWSCHKLHIVLCWQLIARRLVE